MKNSYSNIFAFNKKNLSNTVNYLKNGNIVGLPTETVYGLGEMPIKKSVKKIFKIKGRPITNPLIVHYYDLKGVIKDVEVNNYFLNYTKSFALGTITFILKKKTLEFIHLPQLI